MTFALLFLIVFLVGPMLFRALTRPAPGRGNFRQLAGLSAMAALIGLGVRFALPDLWGQNLPLTAVAIILVWCAWIAILAYGTQALRQTDAGRTMRIWTGVLGAIGTTVPWFGLASAQMLAG